MIKCNLAKVDAGFYRKGKREAGWKNREWWRRIEIYGDCCWILDWERELLRLIEIDCGNTAYW